MTMSQSVVCSNLLFAGPKHSNFGSRFSARFAGLKVGLFFLADSRYPDELASNADFAEVRHLTLFRKMGFATIHEIL